MQLQSAAALMSIFGIFFLVGGVILAAVLIAFLTGYLKTKYKNWKHPFVSVPARVIAKRPDIYGSRLSGKGDSDSVYHVTFLLEDGRSPELVVDGKEYGILSIGDEGTLTYRDYEYRSFQKGPSGQD